MARRWWTPERFRRDVLASLLLYIAVYLVMYPAGLAYMGAMVRRGLPAADPDVAAEAWR